MYACVRPLTISEGNKTKTWEKNTKQYNTKQNINCLVSTQNHKLLPGFPETQLQVCSENKFPNHSDLGPSSDFIVTPEVPQAASALGLGHGEGNTSSWPGLLQVLSPVSVCVSPLATEQPKAKT